MITPCTRTGPREAPPRMSTMSEKNAISRLISSKVVAGEAARADCIALARRGVTLGGLPDLQLGLRFGEGVPPVGAGIHSPAI